MACAASPGALEVARARALPVDDATGVPARAPTGLRGGARAPPAGAPRWTSRAAASAFCRCRDQPARHLQPGEPVGVIARWRQAWASTLPVIGRAARRFAGVRRRQEVRGVAAGVTVIDDFAHHPTAMRETLAGAARAATAPGSSIAVFEPRSATSRRVGLPERVRRRARRSPTRSCWRRCSPGEGPRRVSAWTSSAWPPICAARACRRASSPPSTRPPRTWPSAPPPGDTDRDHVVGRLRRPARQGAARLGDPVMPARLEHKSKIANLLDRVGIAHPVLDQFWPHYLVIPARGRQRRAGRLRGRRDRRRRRAAAHAGGGARPSRRGARLPAGGDGDGAGAHRRACGASTW